MKKGTILNEVFDRLKTALDVVSGIEALEFAMSEDYGVVTSCPTNLGTGMRASLHIQLPNLTADGTDAKAKEIAKPLGLSVRGLGGEHTPIGVDGTVDISPSARFCITEAQIVTALYKGIEKLKLAEDAAAPPPPAVESEELDFLSPAEEAASWQPGEATTEWLKRLNYLRTKPREFAAEVLVPLRQYFHSHLFDMGDGAGQRRLTSEGIAVLEDAIRFLKRVEPCPPLRLSRPLCRVAARRLADEVGAAADGGPVAAAPEVAGCRVVATCHGAMGGRSTLACRQISAAVIRQARRYRGVIPFESLDSLRSANHHAAAVTCSTFSMPKGNRTVQATADDHLAHMLMDDGNGYRPSRRIFLTAEFTVVGFASTAAPGLMPPLMGAGCYCILAESCQLARQRLPPPPIPPPPVTVSDLIENTRAAFQRQEATSFVRRKMARNKVLHQKVMVGRAAREAACHTLEDSIFSQTTICLRNSVRAVLLYLRAPMWHRRPTMHLDWTLPTSHLFLLSNF
jgi:hypothetical protein